MRERDAARVALERFCADAHPRLVAALAHHTGDPWLAEELAQEALVRACDHWSTVSRLQSPLGWTFRVGANLGSSHFRRRGAERRARARRGREPDTHYDADTVDRVAVRDALASLTPNQREVVLARFFLGLSAEETAEALGSTSPAVRATTHRAVVALRDVLAVDVDLEEDTRGT